MMGLAGVALAGCLVACWYRVGYPFELEWCEGPMVDVVRRLLAGQAIYAAPSVAYTSHEYTPLYYVVSAAVAQVFGATFFSLRLVSFVSFLACLGLIAWITWRETRSGLWAFVAAGLYAAPCGLVDGWFTTARADNLLVALFLLFLCVVERPCASTAFLDWRAPESWGSIGRAVLTGVLLFAAFFAKQSALMMSVPVLAYVFARSPRRGALMGGVAVVLVVASTWILNRQTDGWYGYYIVDLLGQQKLVPEHYAGFWVRDLGRHFLPALLLSVVGCGFALRRGDGFWAAALAGVLGGCWLSRIHEGSWLNSELPAFALLAVLGAVGAGKLFAQGGAITSVAAGALIAGQFAQLSFNPWWIVPAPSQEAAARDFAALLRATPGEIFMPFKGNLEEIAGKTSYANGVSTWDLMRGTDARLQGQLMDDIRAAFARGDFSVVILSIPHAERYPIEESGRYVKLAVQVIPPELHCFPSFVYVRRDLPGVITQYTKALGTQAAGQG